MYHISVGLFDHLVQKVQSRYYKESHEIMDEEKNVAGYLLKERKMEINDDKPVHIGFSILAWSKFVKVKPSEISLLQSFLNCFKQHWVTLRFFDES